MDRIVNMLWNNSAAWFVLGESRLEQELQQAVTHAINQYEAQVQMDSKEFDQDLDQIANKLSSTDPSSSSSNA